jgi:hypothetical protein
MVFLEVNTSGNPEIQEWTVSRPKPRRSVSPEMRALLLALIEVARSQVDSERAMASERTSRDEDRRRKAS